MSERTVNTMWRVDSAFSVDSVADLYAARQFAGGVRVIETCVGAYGALDTKFGTHYFDVGDALVKVKTNLGNLVLVVNANEVTQGA